MIDVFYLEKTKAFVLPSRRIKESSAIISVLWRISRDPLRKKGPGPLQGQPAIQGKPFPVPIYFSYKAACKIFVLHEICL